LVFLHFFYQLESIHTIPVESVYCSFLTTMVSTYVYNSQLCHLNCICSVFSNFCIHRHNANTATDIQNFITSAATVVNEIWTWRKNVVCLLGISVCSYLKHFVSGTDISVFKIWNINRYKRTS
jgi:hypothetical protein